jgi:curved DNA-binding protein CbpA
MTERAKDYYRVLNINTAASLQQIQKAYRLLALRFHPDKNPDNKAAADHFASIKEAYDVLKDQRKRAIFNRSVYARQKASGPRALESVGEILRSAMSLHNNLALSDPLRINRDVLYAEIQELLSDNNRLVFKRSADALVLKKFTETILTSCTPLAHSAIQTICAKLLEMNTGEGKTIHLISAFLKKHRILSLWNQYKIFVAMLVAMAVCACIYFLTET